MATSDNHDGGQGRSGGVFEGEAGPGPAPPALGLLIAIAALGPLGLTIIVPSMPALPAVFATDYGTVQLTVSLYLIGTAVSQLLYGPISDRFGRRPTLLAGLVLFLTGTALCLFATGIGMLILGRIVQAVGGCAGLVLARAIIRDVYDQDRAASMLAYMVSGMVVAPMVAPAIGGFLDAWFGWRSTMLLLFIAGIAVLGLVWASLSETNTMRQQRLGVMPLVMSYPLLLRRPLFCVYALQAATGSAVYLAFLGGAPFVVIDLMGRSPQEYGLWFASVAVGYMLGNLLAGRFSQRVGAGRMMVIGSAVSTAVGVVLLGATAMVGLTLLVLFGLVLAMEIGNGMSVPNGMAGAVGVDPGRAGAASGLAGFIHTGLGAVVSTATGVWLAQAGTAWPLLVVMAAAAGLSLVTAVVAGHLARADRRTPALAAR